MGVTLSFDSGTTSMWAAKLRSEIPAKGLAGMKAAVHEGARLVQAYAKDAAPHDSGTLGGSIKIFEKIDSLGAEARIGPTAKYGRRIELGYHATDARGRGPYHERGHPYMTEGVRRSQRELVAIFAAHLRSELG